MNRRPRDCSHSAVVARVRASLLSETAHGSSGCARGPPRREAPGRASSFKEGASSRGKKMRPRAPLTLGRGVLDT
eukprot:4154761-Alexandrium_andersonii.AAC.1